jgi:serine phosphatase RsbU (regulator of sigma subunit)
MVGMFAGQTYDEETFPLWPHDLLVFFTDGITEARRGEHFFGTDGIAAVVSRLAAADGRSIDSNDHLAALGDAILAEAEAFAGGRLGDDACLMLVEVSDAEIPGVRDT